MEFKLNTVLADKLIANRVVPVVEEKKKTTKPKTATPYLPLIPTTILSEEEQENTVKRVIEKSGRYRSEVRRVEGVSLSLCKSTWCAIWESKSDKYVYGAATCFSERKLEEISETSNIFNEIINWDSEERIKVKRTTYIRRIKLVTKEDLAKLDDYFRNRDLIITNGFTGNEYKRQYVPIDFLTPTNSSYDVERFLNSISTKHISNTGVHFGAHRPKVKTLEYKFNIPHDSLAKYYNQYEKYGFNPLTTEWFIKEHLEKIYPNNHLKNKSMVKLYQKECDLINHLFSDTKDLNMGTNVIRTWEKLKFMVGTIARILDVWPDCPVDLIQNNIHNFVRLYLGHNGSLQFGNAKCEEWLRTNMKPAVFFSIVQAAIDAPKSSQINPYNRPPHYKDVSQGLANSMGEIKNFAQWNDVMGLLNTCLSSKETVEPPPRWRLETFHDYLMKKSWEVKGPGRELPTDLIPDRIELKAKSGRVWTFQQPKCSNYLAWWGQAVRNCVGGSYYAQQVENRSIYLILCLIDDKPNITVNMYLDSGRLRIREIRTISNANLDAQTTKEFELLFSQVLKQLTEEIVRSPLPKEAPE
jgi:hypothetical protein